MSEYWLDPEYWQPTNEETDAESVEDQEYAY